MPRRIACFAVLALSACGTDTTSSNAPPFGPPWPWQLADAAAPVDGAAPPIDGSSPLDAPAPPVDGALPEDASPPPPRSPAIAVYWGQDDYGGANPGSPQSWEKPLDQTCIDGAEYDIVIIAGLTRFVRTRNASGLPEENFANHCSTPYDASDPAYFKCDAIAQGIKTCQSLGKRVLISIGGGGGGYGFAGDVDAQVFAGTVWDAFLGGAGSMRTFGTAVLDGVDLDIESGTSAGYGAFAARIRALATAAGGRHYLVTGAPACTYPDAYLGPGTGTALGTALSAFDYLFVRFFDDAACEYTTSPLLFTKSWNQWAALAGNAGPKVFVGLPSAQAAATSGYVSRATLPALVTAVKGNTAFGGVMLFEASYDQNSTQSGTTYGAYAASLVR